MIYCDRKKYFCIQNTSSVRVYSETIVVYILIAYDNFWIA